MLKSIVLNYWFFSVLIILLICFGPILINIGLVSPIVGLVITCSAVIFAPVAIIHGAWLTWWKNNRAGFLGMYIGVGLLGYLLTIIISASDHPRINDISTDLVNPPRLLLNDQKLPAEFLPKIEEFYSNITAKVITEGPKEAFEKSIKILEKEESLKVIKTDSENFMIYFTQTSGVFKFVDDAVIRIQPVEKGSKIDMRSKSRDGKGDFGVNAVRIKRILNQL